MEKVKITKKELDEIYELVPDIEDTENIPEELQAKNQNFNTETDNFSFEEFTEHFDKEGKKVVEDAT